MTSPSTRFPKTGHSGIILLFFNRKDAKVAQGMQSTDLVRFGIGECFCSRDCPARARHCTSA